MDWSLQPAAPLLVFSELATSLSTLSQQDSPHEGGQVSFYVLVVRAGALSATPGSS